MPTALCNTLFLKFVAVHVMRAQWNRAGGGIRAITDMRAWARCSGTGCCGGSPDHLGQSLPRANYPQLCAHYPETHDMSLRSCGTAIRLRRGAASSLQHTSLALLTLLYWLLTMATKPHPLACGAVLSNQCCRINALQRLCAPLARRLAAPLPLGLPGQHKRRALLARASHVLAAHLDTLDRAVQRQPAAAGVQVSCKGVGLAERVPKVGDTIAVPNGVVVIGRQLHGLCHFTGQLLARLLPGLP